jgi:hypothetical protein
MARRVLVLEEEKGRALAEREPVARLVEGARGRWAQRAERVEAREHEGRQRIGAAREDARDATLADPRGAEPDRGRSGGAGRRDRRDGPPRAGTPREERGEGARRRAREKGRPGGEAAAPGLLARERRPHGNSGVLPAERRPPEARERLGGRGEGKAGGAVVRFSGGIGRDVPHLGGRLCDEARRVEARDGRNRAGATPRGRAERPDARPERGHGAQARHGDAALPNHLLLIIHRRALFAARTGAHARPTRE